MQCSQLIGFSHCAFFLLSFPEGLNFLSGSQSKKCQGEWAGLGVQQGLLVIPGADAFQGAGWESLAWFRWSRGIWLSFARQKKGMHFPASGYANHWGGGGRGQAGCESFFICVKMEFKTFPLEWYPIPKLDLGTQSTWIFVLSIRVICIQNPFLVCFLYHASFLIHFQSLMYCCVASSPIRPCNVLRLPSAWLHLIASVNRT